MSRNGDNGFDSDPYPLQHIHASHGGGVAHVDNRNQISTPQMVAIIISVVISCLALGLWYSTSTTMALYEREIRLAQRDAQDAKNQVNTLKEVLEIVGLKVPKKEDDNEQQ